MDMDGIEILRSIIALAFVLGLVLLVAWLVRRYGIDKNWQIKQGKVQRLQLLERLTIDPKRQLVLIRRDKKEHVLLLGTNNEALVVESYDPDTDTTKTDT